MDLRLICLLTSVAFVDLGSGQGFDIKAAINAFCAQNPSSTGCERHGPRDVRPPQPGDVSCSGGASRICPQLQNKCVPREFACSVLDSRVKCQIPQSYNLVHQVLLCGDGTQEGLTCGTTDRVPVLTMLLLQCQGPDGTDMYPVNALEQVSEDNGSGAGVYRCGTSGSWEPLFQSPFLNVLSASCTKSGCGGVPQPTSDRPVHRPWSWVRALYHKQKIQCTTTLISSDAVLTAAHCITKSTDSNLKLETSDFRLELPGPNKVNKRIQVQPTFIHLHPRYNPMLNTTNLKHDIAIIKFNQYEANPLPIACLSDSPRLSNQGTHMVFGLQHKIGQSDRDRPIWIAQKANRDQMCVAIDTRTSVVNCQRRLTVQPFQFCASHPELTMTSGSSGGPYLVEVGSGVKEVWEVAGVLSYVSNRTDCQLSHSVYNHVAEDTDWIRECVFNNIC